MERFHLKPEVTIGHLLTTVALAMTLLSYYSDSKDRDTRIQVQITQLEERLAAEKDSTQLLRTTIGTRLNRIDKKLDRVLDSMMQEARKQREAK